MQAKIVMIPALKAMTAGPVVKIAARRWARRTFASPRMSSHRLRSSSRKEIGSPFEGFCSRSISYTSWLSWIQN